MKIIDTYYTISKSSQKETIKLKNSKFYGYAYPVSNEKDVKYYIENLKKNHHSASHCCYAYRLGSEKINYRTNDDGEPKNSAGLPIYSQIQSFGVTDILIVVVRYYGGTKLGISGLINAYKKTAQLTLENSIIIRKTINKDYLISFDYQNINRVMRIIKEKQLHIVSQKLEHQCQIHVQVRIKEAKSIIEIFENLFKVDIKPLN